MRPLLAVLIPLALLLTFGATTTDTALSAPALTLINLTKDPAVERNPAIGWSVDGGVTVAWEQNIKKNGVVQKDIMARVKKDGSFGPAFDISDNPAPSQTPTLLNTGSLISVLYQETWPGSSEIMRSDWSGTAWSTPEGIAGGDYVASFTPAGVQASDGSTWVARWVRTTGNYSDIIVQQIGGPAFNVSNDGRAWRNPDLVAGDSGQVYVAWIDHTRQPAGFVPGVRVAEVTTGGVVLMPQPTNDYFAYWSSLAIHGDQIYAIWLGTTSRMIRERIWNGSSWSPQLNIGSGDKPRLAATAGGTVYVAWENNGQIFLRKNLAPRRLVSGNLKAQQVALAVDDAENAHIAFLAGGDVWYVQVPAH